MVFEFNDQWIILDMDELTNYVQKHNLKDLELSDLVDRLEWTIKLPKAVE